MATVINNPPSSVQNTDSSVGVIIGVIVLAILAIMFFVYGLPALRGAGSGQETNITVPDRINVDVQTPNAQ